MTQNVTVLYCDSCKTYQARLLDKWLCSSCYKMQPVQQIHYQGSGQDCLRLAKRLNSLKDHETPFSATTSKQDDKSNDNTSDTLQKLEDDRITLQKFRRTEEEERIYQEICKDLENCAFPSFLSEMFAELRSDPTDLYESIMAADDPADDMADREYREALLENIMSE